MWDYFKPLLRKFGVLALGLSCVLMLGWLRSLLVQDTFSIASSMSRYIKLGSVCQYLMFASIEIDPSQGDRSQFWRSGRASNVWQVEFAGVAMGISLRSHPISFNGSAFGLGNTMVSGHVYRLSYSTIVIPLTLLSAYLLLIKPKASTKAASSASDAGG